MSSAATMSAMIRAKKKKMQEEHSDAVKLSGIPEDATDARVIEDKEYGEMLSENTPKERDEMPTPSAEIAQEREAQPHEDAEPAEELDVLKSKKAKIGAIMKRLGK